MEPHELKVNELIEMTDMKEKRIFLEVCIGIERLCADVYHYYSEIYEDVPEASRLWKKTALDEESHQNQFELALRMFNETEFEVPKESLKRAYSIQYKLLKLMNLVKNTRPDLLIAVSKAVEMEVKFADLHAHAALKFKDESMQKLFMTMSKADHEHVAALQRYRSILYLPQCEMVGG